MAFNKNQQESASVRIGAIFQDGQIVPSQEPPEWAQSTQKKRGRKPQPELAGREAQTFLLKPAALEVVKAIARWEGKTQSEVINDAIKAYREVWKPTKKTPPTLPTIE